MAGGGSVLGHGAWDDSELGLGRPARFLSEQQAQKSHLKSTADIQCPVYNWPLPRVCLGPALDGQFNLVAWDVPRVSTDGRRP